jgi:MFS family permease
MASSIAASRRLPTGIWALGFVSLLMDMSSEMIHSLLPVYLMTVLGASALAVGAIEGIAEATASITKIFSGVLSDRLGKRKALVVAGYALAAITKPIFPLAPTIGWMVAARFVDRVGKGIRGAPRDALIADISPPHLRGASYGLRQSLDTVGAILGPMLAMVLMWLTMDSFITVFWVAVVPAFIGVAVLVVFVREPPQPQPHAIRPPLRWRDAIHLGRAFWAVIALSSLFFLARFSEGFLILRAQGAGVAIYLLPLVLVAMNIVYALCAYPAGALSDRTGRFGLLLIGLGVLVAADVVLALFPTLLGIGLGVGLWGLHMGLTHGILSALVADAAPAELRGTAFGMFNLVSGLALLAASLIAGLLWDIFGPAATFMAGAILAVAAMAALWALRASLPGATR